METVYNLGARCPYFNQSCVHASFLNLRRNGHHTMVMVVGVHGFSEGYISFSEIIVSLFSYLC